MLRRLAVLACLAALPALGSAQNITITESNDTDGYVNTAECNNSPVDQLAFAWAVTVPATSYDLYVSDQAGCPANGSTVNGVATNAHTANVAVGILQTSYNNGNTAAALLNSAQIQCLSTSTALFVCVFANGTTANAIATGSVKLDLTSAPAPVLTSVSPGDGSLQVTWRLGTGTGDGGTAGSADRFTINYAPSATPTSIKQLTITGGGLSGRITGLTNGVEYTVTVTALTIGGNASEPSTALTGTPHVVNDFWRQYQLEGGRETGGCATGAAGLTALLALTPLLLRRKRRRS
jgi:Synergist-CTERM protein sorting domain-containing protein